MSGEILDPVIAKHIQSHMGGIVSEYESGRRKSIYYNLRKVYDSSNDETPCDVIENIVEVFSSGLRADNANAENGDDVSECSFFAPRRPKPKCMRKVIVSKVALALYPVDNVDDADAVTKSYIWYQSCISKLTRQFKKQEFTKLVVKEKFKISRLAEHRELWDELRMRPIHDYVLNPVAMPVDIANAAELASFFNFLSGSSTVSEKNAGENVKWIAHENCLQFERGAVYTDGRMDLCKQVVGPTHIGKLMDSIRRNESISHFLLGNNIIGEEGGTAIKDFLLSEHHPRIRTWYLAGNALNNIAIGNLVDGLISNSDVEELWLKRNPIKPNGSVHIRRLLEGNNRIRTLDLHNTGLLDEGFETVCEGLKSNTSVKLIYFEANGITKIDPMVSYFEHMKLNGLAGITSLWIGMNRIGDEGAVALVRAVSGYPLVRLCMGSNMISADACREIYKSLKSHPTLELLDLGLYKSTADMGEITNRISDDGAIAIADLIRENHVLKYVSVLHNDIGHVGMHAINEALQHNSTLLYLEYKQYFSGISNEITASINKKLQENRNAAGISNPTTHLRFLKHTENIVNIDSIYRNNGSATGPSCSVEKRKHIA